MTNQNMEDIGEPPKGLNILSILYVVGGIFWLIYPVIYSWLLAGALRDYYGYVPWAKWITQTVCCWIGSIIIAGVYFGIAAGLKKGMPSARVWAIIFAIIGLFNVPIGTILSIIILIYLFTPDVKAWFEKGAKREKAMIEEMQKQQKFKQMEEEEKTRKEYEEFQEYKRKKEQEEKGE